ncbi:serine hydrolase [Nannocystis pusilla]|uniref:serine hydrolase n=1 Tax=Nannocystis pusilla TaxID=889268 RepID=UPI003B7CD52F
MSDTDFEPLLTMASKMSRVAGTGEFAHAGDGTPPVPGGYRRGEVQDDQDWWTQRHNAQFPSTAPTGAGCDGLFSTALDLGKFAQALLDGGQIWDPYNCEYVPFFATATVSGLLHWQTHDNGVPIGTDPVASFTDNLINAHKAFGFELLGLDWAAGGDSLQGVYKTGGAGTFLIIDPLRDLFIVVLTNHGLPDPDDFADQFDAMIDEIGPDRIAESVALAVVDSGGSSS